MPPTTALVITCIGGHMRDNILLRAGINRSKKLGVPWVVLHIETPSVLNSFEDRETLARMLANAEAAGATVMRRQAQSVDAGLVAYIREQEPDAKLHVLIGETYRRWHMPCRRGNKARTLRRHAGADHTVEIIPLAEIQLRGRFTFFAPLFRGAGFRGIMEAVSFIAIATLASELLRQSLVPDTFNLYHHNISLIYLIATVITATRCGMIPAMIASVISFVTLNFFYTVPFYELGNKQTADTFNLLLFLGAAIFISLFGSGTHAYILQAKERERYLQALVTIGGTLNRSFTRQEALQYLHREMKALLHMEVTYFLPGGFNSEMVGTVYPPEASLEGAALKAFEQCWREYLPTGYGTTHYANAGWRFDIMMSANGFVGIIGAKVPPDTNLAMSLGLTLTVLADLSASILDRIDQTQLMEESRVQEEREKLRSMLLSSVSHDLKTPLASIIGSLDIYHRLKASLSEERARALTQTAYDEAIRLDSFITNIIDMARLESGKFPINREWGDPVQMVRRSLRRLEARISGHEVAVQEPSQQFEVEMDSGMMEKVMFHVLDNAVKYAPARSKVDIRIGYQDGQVTIVVEDAGVGVPEGMEEAVFNKYTRLHKQDMAVAGTGLGLPISRAIVMAHGGHIHLERKESGGTRVTIELPHARPLETLAEESETA